MEKKECKQIGEMFDEIEFIERLEQFAANAKNGIRILATPQCSNFKPIAFPASISNFIMGSLASYKDSLKDILTNLRVVDKSVLPDPEEPNEPTPDPITPEPENPVPDETETEGSDE